MGILTRGKWVWERIGEEGWEAFMSRRVEAKHARDTHGSDAPSLPLKVESGCLVSARAITLSGRGSTFRRNFSGPREGDGWMASDWGAPRHLQL